MKTSEWCHLFGRGFGWLNLSFFLSFVVLYSLFVVLFSVWDLSPTPIILIRQVIHKLFLLLLKFTFWFQFSKFHFKVRGFSLLKHTVSYSTAHFRNCFLLFPVWTVSWKMCFCETFFLFLNFLFRSIFLLAKSEIKSYRKAQEDNIYYRGFIDYYLFVLWICYQCPSSWLFTWNQWFQLKVTTTEKHFITLVII